MSAEATLTQAPRLLLSGRGPAVGPLPFWWDGAHAWALVPAGRALAAALTADPECEGYVPALADDPAGVRIRGRALLLGTADPLRLVLHGPPLAAALAGLGLKYATSILEPLADFGGAVGRLAQQAVRDPSTLVPERRTVVRIVAHAVDAVAEPPVGPGIAPPLPPVVPAELRRAVAGVRNVVLAVDDGERLRVTPAVWSAGFGLEVRPEVHLPATAAAVVTVGDIAVAGTLEGRRLRLERVTWWAGGQTHDADIPAAPAGAVVLPD